MAFGPPEVPMQFNDRGDVMPPGTVNAHGDPTSGWTFNTQGDAMPPQKFNSRGDAMPPNDVTARGDLSPTHSMGPTPVPDAVRAAAAAHFERATTVSRTGSGEAGPRIPDGLERHYAKLVEIFQRIGSAPAAVAGASQYAGYNPADHVEPTRPAELTSRYFRRLLKLYDDGEAYENERYLKHTRNPFKHPEYLQALVEYWEAHERVNAQSERSRK